MRDFFFGIMALCLFSGFFLSFSKIGRELQRRIYWACACLAAVSGFLMTYPTWNNALVLGITPFALMTFAAYAFSPYIKIRGKIYALTVQDRRPDPDDLHTEHKGALDSDGALAAPAAGPETDPADAYGGLLTPATMWWLLIVLAVIATGNMYGFITRSGYGPVAAVMAGFLFLIAIATGYGDASWHYPIARRQYLQFGIVSVITAGTFTLVYLTAYYADRLWPFGRAQSGGHRAHPRRGE